MITPAPPNPGQVAYLQGMPMLTLWQPWASWIALGWKTIETRTHNQFSSLRGQRVGIHAGLKWDKDAIGLAERFITLEQMHMSEEFQAIRGAIVCTAMVSNYGKLSNDHHSRAAMIDCARTVRYGLFLTDLKAMEPPVLAKGSQGIWKYDQREQSLRP